MLLGNDSRMATTWASGHMGLEEEDEMKIATGIELLDRGYGGAYRGRGILVSGKCGAGKTELGLRFIAEGLENEEAGMILSAQPARDLALQLSNMGVKFSNPTVSGNLYLYEYKNFIPSRDREETLAMTCEGGEELCQILAQTRIRRLVLDTALPWITLPTMQTEKLPEHIYTFMSRLEDLRVTTLLTLPMPVSKSAVKLRALVEACVPVSVVLQEQSAAGRLNGRVSKYLGVRIPNEQTPVFSRLKTEDQMEKERVAEMADSRS